MLNLTNVKPQVWARTIALGVCLFNLIMKAIGHPVIEIDDAEIEELVNSFVDIVSACVYVWTWWKDNPFTAEAQAANKYMKVMKFITLFNEPTEEERENND